MKNFKAFPICILLISSIFNTLFAQADSSGKDRRNEIALDVRPAVLMALGGQFVPVVMLDYRRNFATKTLRAGFMIGATGYNDFLNYPIRQVTGKSIGQFGFKVGMEQYILSSAKKLIQPYYGIEVGMRYRDAVSDGEINFMNDDSSFTWYDYELHQYQVGFTGSIFSGIKMNVSERFSLMAEFAPEINFYSSRNHTFFSLEGEPFTDTKSKQLEADITVNAVVGRIWLAYKF